MNKSVKFSIPVPCILMHWALIFISIFFQSHLNIHATYKQLSSQVSLCFIAALLNSLVAGDGHFSTSKSQSPPILSVLLRMSCSLWKTGNSTTKEGGFWRRAQGSLPQSVLHPPKCQWRKFHQLAVPISAWLSEWFVPILMSAEPVHPIPSPGAVDTVRLFMVPTVPGVQRTAKCIQQCTLPVVQGCALVG